MRLPDLGERGQGWVWLQAMLMAAIPTVGGLAPPWPAPAQIPMLAVGLSLVLLGCALLVAGVLGLGESFGVFPEPTPNRGLVTTGFSPWALPLSGVLVLELLGKTSVEERHLTVQYPTYAGYRTQVPRRFFPIPTRR